MLRINDIEEVMQKKRNIRRKTILGNTEISLRSIIEKEYLYEINKNDKLDYGIDNDIFYKFKKEFFVIDEIMHNLAQSLIIKADQEMDRDLSIDEIIMYRNTPDEKRDDFVNALTHQKNIKEALGNIYYNEIMTQAYQCVFISYYSLVESTLQCYCQNLQQKLDIKISYNDLSHNGIVGLVKYLQNVVKIGEIENNKIYANIKIINNIRNDIVHRRGRIDQSENIEIYYNELGVKSIDNYIYLSYENVQNIASIIFEFIDMIFKLL